VLIFKSFLNFLLTVFIFIKDYFSMTITETNFNSLNLPDAVLKATQDLGYKTPTPIQSQAIPLILAGGDLIGCAQTGTGKTAAFCLPILVHLLQNPNKNAIALILAPTRELALQIDAFWSSLTKSIFHMHSVCIIGGGSMQPQRNALSRRPRVVIATPGRLLDHMEQRTVNLANVSILVLDEADRMLDMGFAPQLERIRRALPAKRQSLLFSATWPKEIDRLAQKYLIQPKKVSVGPITQAAPLVSQATLETTNNRKNELLLDQLNKLSGSVLVFTRTKFRTDKVARYLASYGMEVNRIHGDRSQGQRNAALKSFRDGKIRVLVATDIASRGIDVADIAHVINFDLPQSAEDYIHRIGRTGRAGVSGNAISFITPEDRWQWGAITNALKKTGSVNIQRN
jgi:ATP-dependent RNA helicase RhlE